MRHRRGARARGRHRGDVPRGHAPREGPRKKREARPHTGAARIALAAGVPLVPAAIGGTDRLSRLGPLRVAYGEPIDARRSRRHETTRAASMATERLMAAIERAEGDAVTSRCSSIDGDSLAHRAYHALPKSIRRATDGRQRARRLREHARRVSGRPSSRAPWSSAGTRSTCRPTGTRRSAPTRRPRVRADAARAARPCCPSSSARWASPARRARGYEADDFLGAAVALEEKRGGEALVATSDRDMFQLASERTTILQPDARRVRARADRAGRGARALRRRAGAGAGLHRAARRPVGQAAGRARASGRRRRPTCCASTARWRRRSRPAASRQRRRNCASSVESRPWTPPPRSLPSQTRHPRGRRRPLSSSDWGLNGLAERLVEVGLSDGARQPRRARASSTRRDRTSSRGSACSCCSTPSRWAKAGRLA